MTVDELIEELRNFPPLQKISVFVDWPEEPEEQSGWYEIDKVRVGGDGVEIRLV